MIEIDFEDIRKKVIDNIDMTREPENCEIHEIIDNIVQENLDYKRLSIEERIHLHKKLFHSIRGLGIIEEMLSDDNITEIMINGTSNIFVEREGRIERVNVAFDSEGSLNNVIQQIVGRTNRRVNESVPIVDTRLSDGSRVNIVIPPIALDGSMITIRKFPKDSITISDLIKWESISKEAADFLRKLVIAGYNIFVCGGTGSGKTTFLNMLSNFIPSEERVITIEDSAELQLRNIDNLVRMEARPANSDGSGKITIRDLIKTSLRMRPDRIVVGEVRGEEALDMLQAMNTGHDGSMSTGHANSPKDMLSRLETMVLMGLEIPLSAIRAQIASGIDIIVYLGRLRDKTRKVLEIDEVENFIDGEIIINPLFIYKEKTQTDGIVIGSLERTENQLKNTTKMHRKGIVNWG